MQKKQILLQAANCIIKTTKVIKEDIKTGEGLKLNQVIKVLITKTNIYTDYRGNHNK